MELELGSVLIQSKLLDNIKEFNELKEIKDSELINLALFNLILDFDRIDEVNEDFINVLANNLNTYKDDLFGELEDVLKHVNAEKIIKEIERDMAKNEVIKWENKIGMLERDLMELEHAGTAGLKALFETNKVELEHD